MYINILLRRNVYIFFRGTSRSAVAQHASTLFSKHEQTLNIPQKSKPSTWPCVFYCFWEAWFSRKISWNTFCLAPPPNIKAHISVPETHLHDFAQKGICWRCSLNTTDTFRFFARLAGSPPNGSQGRVGQPSLQGEGNEKDTKTKRTRRSRCFSCKIVLPCNALLQGLHRSFFAHLLDVTWIRPF